jgi:hypothetical protein
MSAANETLRETAALIRQLGLQVRDVAELRAVMKQLQPVLNPEAGRARSAVIACSVVAIVSFVTAAVASFFAFLMASTIDAGDPYRPGYWLGALGIIWGVAGLVTLVAFTACFGGPPPTPGQQPTAPPAAESSTSAAPAPSRITLP